MEQIFKCCGEAWDETNLQEVHSALMASRTLGLKADNLTRLNVVILIDCTALAYKDQRFQSNVLCLMGRRC